MTGRYDIALTVDWWVLVLWWFFLWMGTTRLVELIITFVIRLQRVRRKPKIWVEEWKPSKAYRIRVRSASIVLPLDLEQEARDLHKHFEKEPRVWEKKR